MFVRCTLLTNRSIFNQHENAHLKFQLQSDKAVKSLEAQLADVTRKQEEQSRSQSDLSSSKSRLQQENVELNRQVEELEGQIGQLSKAKTTLSKQLEEVKVNLQEETRVRSKLQGEFPGNRRGLKR